MCIRDRCNHKKQLPAETSNQALTRIPMRNYQEGYFTRWHTDLGYPNLYPGLRKLYPDHSTLPEPTAVLQWQQDYQDMVELLRADYADNASNAAAKLGNRQVRIEDLQKSLRRREEIWSPPPHRSRWKTPVPERYFRQANCGLSLIHI